MNRPQQPHASTPTPEDHARMWADLGRTLAAAQQDIDPRPEDERNPHVSAGPVLAVLMVLAAGALVGIAWLGLVALDAIAGSL